MARTNKDKEPDPIIDEVLAETPPDINEPQEDIEDTDIPADEILPDPENEEPQEEVEEVIEEKPELKITPPVETPEQKEQRYKAQQTEAQIQAERNRALTDRVEEAAKIEPPTSEELKAYVRQDGVEWDELTTFEQATARRTYLAEKRFDLVNQAVQNQKKVDEWAKLVDDFIDSTDGKPEFVDLSSHEADFRKFSMKETHRGAPVDILLAAFLHNLPKSAPKRGSLFETGGGGDKIEKKEGITDAETAQRLRTTNPKEYKRQIKAGKIKLEV